MNKATNLVRKGSKMDKEQKAQGADASDIKPRSKPVVIVRPHPQLRPGEVYIGDINPGIFPEIKWKSKRQGTATVPGRKVPLFALKNELDAAGVELGKPDS